MSLAIGGNTGFSVEIPTKLAFSSVTSRCVTKRGARSHLSTEALKRECVALHSRLTSGGDPARALRRRPRVRDGALPTRRQLEGTLNSSSFSCGGWAWI